MIVILTFLDCLKVAEENCIASGAIVKLWAEKPSHHEWNHDISKWEFLGQVEFISECWRAIVRRWLKVFNDLERIQSIIDCATKEDDMQMAYKRLAHKTFHANVSAIITKDLSKLHSAQNLIAESVQTRNQLFSRSGAESHCKDGRTIE